MQDRKLALYETAGSILWFLLDGCWMIGASFGAHALILPTLVLNLLVFRYTERTIASLAITSAMNAWLTMNILWMLGDIHRLPLLTTLAGYFFILGLGCLGIAFLMGRLKHEMATIIFSRFRRLRIIFHGKSGQLS